MPERTTIYRYGLLAWVWRGMIAFVLFGLGLLLFVGASAMEVLPYAVILLAPAAYFGFVVATRVDRIGDSHVSVWTLLLWRRRIACEKIGTAKMRRVYQGRSGGIHAPAAWVPVRRSLPIYLDLLSSIPDRPLLDATFRLPDMSPSRAKKSRT